jgi:predicted transposase YdaD
MATQKYEFQSDFARRYIALGREEGEASGRAEGEARGRAALVIRLLTARFGRIEPQVDDRLRRASIAELDAIGERLLTARSLQDALGS